MLFTYNEGLLARCTITNPALRRWLWARCSRSFSVTSNLEDSLRCWDWRDGSVVRVLSTMQRAPCVVCTISGEARRGGFYPLELALQAVVNHPVWVLGVMLRTSIRGADTLIHWAISPTPYNIYYIIIFFTSWIETQIFLVYCLSVLDPLRQGLTT